MCGIITIVVGFLFLALSFINQWNMPNSFMSMSMIISILYIGSTGRSSSSPPSQTRASVSAPPAAARPPPRASATAASADYSRPANYDANKAANKGDQGLPRRVGRG